MRNVITYIVIKASVFIQSDLQIEEDSTICIRIQTLATINTFPAKNLLHFQAKNTWRNIKTGFGF